MITRLAAKHIDILLGEFPAIALLGPRQVGKTTLAKSLAKKHQKDILYFDLENDADVAKLKDPEYIFNEYKDHCIILDEVQRVPKLFSQLRPIIDNYRKPGRFILTGSASPDLVKGVSESLAGRIAFNELAPINLLEAKKSQISQQQHWFRGGFPLALTAADDPVFIRWTENFIRTYIERDLSQLFGVRLQEKLIRNFWFMLAANNGGIWNSETYGRSLGISGPTIKRYLDFLEGAFLIRQLPAWFVNANKRLVKSPKVYLRDSGLLHVINRVSSVSDLPLNIGVGASWEGYVIEQIFQLKPSHIDVYYYRTHHGAECDVLLVNGITPVLAIEIKFSSNPVLSKGFYTVMEDLKLPEGWVIIPKGNPSKLHANIQCSNLHDFLINKLQEL
ncbi:MAG: ATP-binding protein [Ferruginibacter sp.]|nr:ATP-binding protein [Ferruginibacter sp.]